MEQTCVPSSLLRSLLRAISDPGAFTPRGDNYAEHLVDWQLRAVLMALGQHGVDLDVIPDTEAHDG